MRNFSPVSETRKGQRSWGRVLAPNSRNKANMVKYKIYNFRAYHSFGTWTLKAASLLLNGMLMMMIIQRAMQDNAIRTARIHPAFIPVTGLKCSSYGKISSPLNYWDPGWKKRDLGNRASRVNRASVKRSSVRENLRSLFTFLCRGRTWSVPWLYTRAITTACLYQLTAGECFSFWPFSYATHAAAHYKQINPVRVTRM